MAEPIWRDYVTSFGEEQSSVKFKITCGLDDEELVYTGKAHLRPGEEYVRARINDICADYLAHTLPAMSQSQFTAWTFPVLFKVWRWRELSQSWNQVDEVTFVPDWSYNPYHDIEVDGMADPITSRLNGRQWLVYTAYDADDITFNLRFQDGTESSVIVPLSITPDFNDDFNDDFAKSLAESRSGTAALDLSQWTDLASVEVGGHTYAVTDGCERYAFYYVNAYGGWDTFLVEGQGVVSDELERHAFEQEYDNRYTINRSRREFAVEMKRKYVLHTGYLNDRESARMHHLLNSPFVYLFDIERQEMLPVVMDGKNTEYKTFKSNGRKFSEYTIECSLAHNMVRR